MTSGVVNRTCVYCALSHKKYPQTWAFDASDRSTTCQLEKKSSIEKVQIHSIDCSLYSVVCRLHNVLFIQSSDVFE